MDLQPGEVLNDNVTAFCQSVISRHSENWPPDENVLVQEFVDFFAPRSFLTFETSVQLCRDHLRVSVSLAPLPAELRGCNCSYEDKREIVVSQRQTFPGANLHTLLHELREILEATFERLGHPTVDNKDLEVHAESFAIVVQMVVAERELPNLLRNAASIQRKWLRIAAYAVIFLGAFGYALTCAFLPQLEDAFLSHRPGQRNLHT